MQSHVSNNVALLAEGVDRNGIMHYLARYLVLSPSSRRAWIEMLHTWIPRRTPWSPSSRRAWIEITLPRHRAHFAMVALLAEGVDRNASCKYLSASSAVVALLAEGVDRNVSFRSMSRAMCVALLAEGVDRNVLHLSAVVLLSVALLAEDVDRNEPAGWFDKDDFQSPSSRRAWIYTVILLIRDLLSATPAVYR